MVEDVSLGYLVDHVCQRFVVLGCRYCYTQMTAGRLKQQIVVGIRDIRDYHIAWLVPECAQRAGQLLRQP